MRVIELISGFLIFSAPFLLVAAVIKKRKELIDHLSDIPSTLVIISATLLGWALFITPKNICGRGEFGTWHIGRSNLMSIPEMFTSPRNLHPLYMGGIRFLSFLFDGISFVFVANLTTVFFIIGGLLLFFVAKNFFNSEQAGYFASVLYLFNPVIYFYSLTEEYVIIAIFSFILSLFFASLYFKTKDQYYIIPAMISAILAAGFRFEYVFVFYFIILFYLLFYPREDFKNYVKKAVFLLLVALPRTIVTANKYLFNSSKWDTALFEQVYKQEGSAASHFWAIIIDNARVFTDQIFDAINLFNFYDLSGFVLLAGLLAIIIFFVKQKTVEIKKIVFFFLFQIIVIISFYSSFDQVAGLMGSGYRYIIVILMLFTVLAALSLDFLTKVSKITPMLLVLSFGLLSIFLFILPLGLENYEAIYDEDLRGFAQHSCATTSNEYYKYKNLTYGNRLYRFLKTEQADVDIKTGNTYFISNADRSMIHPMPIHGTFIDVWNELELIYHYNQIPDDAKIYVTQSEMGFVSKQPEGYGDLPRPDEFKELVEDLFQVERKIISYEKEGYPFFLYEVSK